MKSFLYYSLFSLTAIIFLNCSGPKKEPPSDFEPTFTLTTTDTLHFNSFVDCNMAEVWVGDTFRIFPGKYGEDPLWGYSRDLKYADGKNSWEAFSTPRDKFKEPILPKNVPPGTDGLHGAMWFETVYQDSKDASGRTLYGVYHNENYPETLPFDGKNGYVNEKWPEGLTGPTSPAAVCRIGIAKSIDGGLSWENKGIFLEDYQSRMILKPNNTSKTFAGGVGDPSAVRSGDYLYLFYGEYGYPDVYKESTYDPDKEWSGQCVSIARIALSDLDNPQGKAKRWNGKEFSASYDSIGAPIASLQIPKEEGGGPASSPTAAFHWGPSVSWNTYLDCWVMVMAKATGPSWAGSSVYISFNKHKDLGKGENAQAWSEPQLLFDRPGYFLWYPSLQPTDSPEDLKEKNTSVKLGKKARLFIKNIRPEKSEYLSYHVIEFFK